MDITLPQSDYIRKLVYALSGIVIEDGKEYLLAMRLGTLLREESLETVEELIREVRDRDNRFLAARVVEALTINETSFFRDQYPFDFLRHHALPACLASRNGRGVRIWSAASASGQEAYSIAMLVHEHFPAATGRVRILASDIAKSMLARVREGLYSELETSRGLPEIYRAKYFRKESGGWRVREDLRRMIDCRRINLADALPPIGPLDVIFLRNVLIYFDLESKRRILRNMRCTLAPGGYLVLGSAESTVRLDGALWTHAHDRCGCYQLCTA